MEAVNNAVSGDDVTILPGSYAPSVTLMDQGKALSIHGQAREPRPIIASTGLAGFNISAPDTVLSDVDVEMNNDSAHAITAQAGTVDRVLAHASGTNMFACAVLGDVTITDSICWASGASGSAGLAFGTATSSATLTLRNDTILATGGDGVALGASTGVTGGHLMVTLGNSIVRGTTHDILAAPGGASDTVVLTADHSNYGDVFTQGLGNSSVTPAGSGTNQTAAPQFVNAAAGDLRETAPSPTVDAGVVSPLNGPLDLDGIPRLLGGSTDIGAYEFVPPPICQPAGASTPYSRPVDVQLVCADVLGAPVTYAIAGGAAHGAVSLDAASGRATYTPQAGYSGPDAFTFAASSVHGTGGPATATITVEAPSVVPDTQPPVLSGLSLLRTRFTLRKGTAFRFTLSEPATVKITFARLVAGRKVGKTCKPATRRLRKRPPCTRRVAAGSLLRRALAQGRHSIVFSGRVRSKALVRGHYVATLAATDPAGNAGRARTLRFTIVRR
ncbi:MAG TPA: Ig-like domain-containing protein [Solirubrobacteraceae bacterium]|nr:Ig-like domain-containing protein [Solirubrobacteraceae bacterium]